VLAGAWLVKGCGPLGLERKRMTMYSEARWPMDLE
jgi:hypothetical protein